MFQRMLSKCEDNLHLELNSDFKNLPSDYSWKQMIYTGPIDSYYNFRFGRLPYRSLEFKHETYDQIEIDSLTDGSFKGFFQPTVQVNYPNDHDYTRIVEIKHATGQVCSNTTIVKEYPVDFSDSNEPYYPVPTKESKEVFKQYELLAKQEKNVTFLGRLACYKYYNMDQVIALALSHYEKI